MRQGQAEEEDLRIEAERRRKYVGSASVRLEFLHFKEYDPDGPNVKFLKACFREDACRHWKAENHIPAVIDEQRLGTALQAAGVSKLPNDSADTYPELVFPDGYQLECLHGQDRIQAAREVPFAGCDLWTVDLFLNDINLELRTALKEEYSNEAKPTDGEIYYKIRTYHFERYHGLESKWKARLRGNRAKNLETFLRHEDLTNALDDLLPIQALFDGRMISVFHTMVAMRSDDELLHCLGKIKSFFMWLFEGKEECGKIDRATEEAFGRVDKLTVKAMELMAPGASRLDAKKLRGQVLGGEICSNFTYEQREKIWERLQSYGGLIPSLFTFFEDILYLQRLVESMKWLFSVPHGTTMRSIIEKSYKGVNQRSDQVMIQVSESEFTPIPGNSWDRKDLGRRQLYAYAMRHYVKIPKKPVKENRRAKSSAIADETVLHNFAELAYRLGFESPEITALRQLSSSSVSEALGNSRPLLVTAGAGEVRKERCGIPCEKAYTKDRESLFIDNLHEEREEQGEGITSFFVLRSRYFAFFGRPGSGMGLRTGSMNHQPPPSMPQGLEVSSSQASDPNQSQGASENADHSTRRQGHEQLDIDRGVGTGGLASEQVNPAQHRRRTNETEAQTSDLASEHVDPSQYRARTDVTDDENMGEIYDYGMDLEQQREQQEEETQAQLHKARICEYLEKMKQNLAKQKEELQVREILSLHRQVRLRTVPLRLKRAESQIQLQGTKLQVQLQAERYREEVSRLGSIQERLQNARAEMLTLRQDLKRQEVEQREQREREQQQREQEQREREKLRRKQKTQKRKLKVRENERREIEEQLQLGNEMLQREKLRLREIQKTLHNLQQDELNFQNEIGRLDNVKARLRNMRLPIAKLEQERLEPQFQAALHIPGISDQETLVSAEPLRDLLKPDSVQVGADPAHHAETNVGQDKRERMLYEEDDEAKEPQVSDVEPGLVRARDVGASYVGPGDAGAGDAGAEVGNGEDLANLPLTDTLRRRNTRLHLERLIQSKGEDDNHPQDLNMRERIKSPHASQEQEKREQKKREEEEREQEELERKKVHESWAKKKLENRERERLEGVVEESLAQGLPEWRRGGKKRERMGLQQRMRQRKMREQETQEEEGKRREMQEEERQRRETREQGRRRQQEETLELEEDTKRTIANTPAVASQSERETDNKVRIDFKLFEGGVWKDLPPLLVDPSDLSEIERVAKQYKDDKTRLCNWKLRKLDAHDCFRNVTGDGTNTILLIPKEIPFDDKLFASASRIFASGFSNYANARTPGLKRPQDEISHLPKLKFSQSDSMDFEREPARRDQDHQD